MEDLPKARIGPVKAFQKTGIDFDGPFYIKSSLRQKRAVAKNLCLFNSMFHHQGSVHRISRKFNYTNIFKFFATVLRSV